MKIFEYEYHIIIIIIIIGIKGIHFINIKQKKMLYRFLYLGIYYIEINILYGMHIYVNVKTPQSRVL